MAGTIRSEAYISLLQAIVNLRTKKSLSQADLAVQLGKPPSFVGKYELGERRLDVIEVFVILTALNVDPITFLSKEVIDLPVSL